MKWLGLVWLLLASDAPCFDASDLQGLSIERELSRTALEVEGVPLLVERVRGRDVERLAQRIGARWAASGSPTRGLQHGEWQLLSRLDQRWSEVIQWRLHAGDGELLFSRLDLAARPAPPSLPFPLPAGCERSRTVRARDAQFPFSTTTFRCNGNASGLAIRLAPLLRDAGWQVKVDTPSMLQLDRRGESAQVLLTEEPDRHFTRAVLVTATTPGATR